jgi:hypothetical protein
LGSGGSQFIHRDLRFTYTSIELRDYWLTGCSSIKEMLISFFSRKEGITRLRGEGNAVGLLLAARAGSWELADSTSCWLFDVTKYGSFT